MKTILRKVVLGILPKWAKDLIGFNFVKTYKHINKGIAKVSYSQQSEDMHVLKLLGRKYGGFFVDVGAFHPFKYSNTYIFYKMGYRGVNIEPNPEAKTLFDKYRKKDINLNIGISNASKPIKYFCFNNPAVNTFNENHARCWEKENNFNIINTKTIQTYTLNSVLERHLRNNQIIDFMSIDVEGMDLEVLDSNDWQKYRPKIVIVEDDCIYSKSGLNVKEGPIIVFMNKNDYILNAITGISLIFVDKNKFINGELL